MPLRLYVEPMDATLVEVSADGRVRFDDEEMAGADAAGAPRDHLRGHQRDRRSEGAARHPAGRPHGVTTARFLAVTLLLFTVLTAAMTWPQVTRMADGVHDPGDPLLITWILAWVAHQLPRAPAHLFDANIFYPERNTLAYSETLVVPGTFAAPLQLARRRPDRRLQPRVPLRIRAVGRGRRAPRAAAHPKRRRGDRRRHRVRVRALPHRSLRAPPAAADPVRSAVALGIPPSARHAASARRAARRRVGRCADADVHGPRPVPRSVHDRRVRDAARRASGADARPHRRARRGSRAARGRDAAGGARVSRGARGGGRARACRKSSTAARARTTTSRRRK